MRGTMDCQDPFECIPMLYKFKSKATGDLILLEASGRRILTLIGKEPSARGIIEVAQMPAAIAALEAAVAHEDAQRRADAEQAQARGGEPPAAPEVSLRQRATPFIDMLRRSHRADEPVVWGV